MIDSEVQAHLEAIQKKFLLTVPEDEDEKEQIAGASEEQLRKLRDHAGCDLPAEYLDFLRYSNGFHCDLETVERITKRSLTDDGELRSYVARMMPAFLVIGGNGRGDYYGLDIRTGKPDRMAYVMTSHEAPGWGNVSQRWTEFKAFFFDIFPSNIFLFFVPEGRLS